MYLCCIRYVFVCILAVFGLARRIRCIDCVFVVYSKRIGRCLIQYVVFERIGVVFMTYSNVFEKYAYSLRICDVFDGIHWYSWYSSVLNTEYVICLVFCPYSVSYSPYSGTISEYVRIRQNTSEYVRIRRKIRQIRKIRS